MKPRNRYSPRKAVPFVQSLPSLTQQTFKDECDIDRVLMRYREMGDYNPFNGSVGRPKPTPIFADFTQIGDLNHVMNRANAIRDYFDALPSSAREALGNSVENFVRIASDPKAVPLLTELGILSLPDVVGNEPKASASSEPKASQSAPEGGAPSSGGASAQVLP